MGSQPTATHSRTWGEPLVPFDHLDVHWDPAEELAYLLHEAIENERHGTAPHAGISEVPGTDVCDNSRLAGLAEITAELPAMPPAPPRHRPSRSHSRKRTAGALRTTSFLLAATAAVVASMVCVFGGMVSYDPLRHLAKFRTSGTTVAWWPLLVYGPWVIASLSILRAALHQRRAVHSWTVVVLFSTVAMLLCVAEAPRTPLDAAAAALPALAALACFQQLIRQITLTSPPRQTHPRHRARTAPPRRTTDQSLS